MNGKDYSWEKEDVYAYTFESPQGAQEGFALLRKYENIHNVLNVNDIITLVAPKEWGFARYGERELLPNPKYVGDDFTTYKEGMEKYLEQFVKSDEKNEFDIQTTVTYRRPMFFRNPALEEDELYVSNEVGSTSTYALSAHDGTEVVPNVEFRGADATNACYNVNVSQKNEFGYILGGGEYSAGSFAEVCASPMYGGEFLGWYSDDVLISSDSVYRFAVKENIELEARFTEVELYDISFISNEGGVVLNEALQVPEGVEINLLAVPFEGYEFDYWLGVDINNMDNLSDSDAKYKVGNSDAIIQANFRKIEQVQDIVDNNTTTENTDEEADINDTETSEKNNDIESSVDVNSGKITLCYILCSLAVNSIIIFAIMLIDKRKARL